MVEEYLYDSDNEVPEQSFSTISKSEIKQNNLFDSPDYPQVCN